MQELRDEVARLRGQLAALEAQSGARREERRSAPRARSDMQMYLERRLAKAAADLQQHLAQHRCR